MELILHIVMLAKNALLKDNVIAVLMAGLWLPPAKHSQLTNIHPINKILQVIVKDAILKVHQLMEVDANAVDLITLMVL